MASVCVHCGCSDIDKDPTRGVAVCTNCGSVLEDQIIVSEVQFEENSRVIGQFVSSEGSKGHNLGSGFHHGMGKESRMITLANGKKRIGHLGAQLKLNQHCIDTAYNFFKMAVARQITRGRKTSHVYAACLYIVCRTEGTAHLLLDFADILQANVYNLGRTYLQLSKELHINIPGIDPCLYIQRYAHKLEFGDKTHDVAKTALRLVSRMKRDWIVQGRRPSGLCGAGLLVAARIHHFSRSIKDIIRVVNIGEGTIRKRLAEFEATSSSSLTVEEFQNIDLEEEADPPCFTQGRRKAKLHHLEDSGEYGKLTEEVEALQTKIDQTLQEIQEKKHKRFGKNNIPSLGGKGESSDLGRDINQLLQQDSIREVFLKAGVGRDDDDDDDDDALQTLDNSEEKDPTVAKLEQDELDLLLRPTVGGITGPRPTAASLGIAETVDQCMGIGNKCEKEEDEDDDDKGNGVKKEESGELDLTGIDDSELDQLILTEEEVKIKALAWIKANSIYLKEQKQKHEKEMREKDEKQSKPDSQKKKRKKKRNLKEASTAGEAIERVIAEKKISSKINYDVLKDLTTGSRRSRAPSPILGAATVEAGSLKSPLGRFRRSSISLDEPPTKISRRKHPRMPIATATSVKEEPEVIVESGPVVYDQQPHEEEEEEYEDEEEPVSAAQLMGHDEVTTGNYYEGFDFDD